MTALRNATQGEYEIQGEIGRGGMAVVYLAHDLALKRKVAIKVMTPALMLMDAGIQERFKREAQTAASLSHPHIIPVYAVKHADDLVFFVMKYIVGRSLESVIKEVGALPFTVVHTILDQSGGALAHAHKRGVIHRDIKPGNIMLDEDGWVVVADFGIAKVAEAEALTMTGGVVGTPAYMSPEQCSGGEVTGAADQYSLGIVAYEMITGRTPFKSGTMVNLIYDHCHTAPPPILDTRPDCPPELAAVVERMIEKDPADRFPSIDEAVSATGFTADSSQEAARGAMLTLAQVSETDKLLKKFQPTGSPAPPNRSGGALSPDPPTPSTPMPHADSTLASRRSVPTWAWTMPLVGVTAIVTWFAFGMRSSPSAGRGTDVVAAPSVASIDVQPPSAMLQVGETLALDAAAHGDDGNRVPEVAFSWQSAAADVADITGSGVVTALSVGTTQITVRTSGASASILVTVTPAPLPIQQAAQPARVASVKVGPALLDLTVGDRARVSATVADGAGAILRGRTISWTSSDGEVVSIDKGGNVLATGAGTAEIRAQSEGMAGIATITVSAVPIAAVTVSPVSIDLSPGETAALSATARDLQQRVLPNRVVVWQSSDPTVARVNATGVVTADAVGTAQIAAPWREKEFHAASMKSWC